MKTPLVGVSASRGPNTPANEQSQDTRTSSQTSTEQKAFGTMGKGEQGADTKSEEKHFKRNLKELFDDAHDDYRNTEKIEARRRKSRMTMIAQQKGFYFSLFACSIMFSAIIIIGFMAFVFRFKVVSGENPGSANYGLFFNISSKYYDLTWATPAWSPSFNFGQIEQILTDETNSFRNLTNLLIDKTYY